MSYTEQQVTEMLKAIGDAQSQLRGRMEARLDEKDKEYDELKKQANAIETVIARGQFPGGGGLPSSSVSAKEHKENFLAWTRRGGNEDALRGLEVQAGLSTLSDPEGGFMVPEEMDRSLDRLAIDSVAMRRLARKVSASGDYKRPFSVGGATGSWVGEKDTREDTDTPELKLFNPPWSEFYALPEVTQALLDMTDFDVAAWLEEEIQNVETTMEGTAFIKGNGVKQPRGILTYDLIANASWEWGKIGYVAGGHATLLNNADKLRSLKFALKPVYRRNGVWLMNDTTQELISNFKNGNGDYIWKQGLTENTPDTLLGSPVEIDDNMDDVGADKYPIAFADWDRAYLIGDHKVGRRLLRDPYTKKGFVKFYFSKRVFGGVINFQALKFLKIATS